AHILLALVLLAGLAALLALLLAGLLARLGLVLPLLLLTVLARLIARLVARLAALVVRHTRSPPGWVFPAHCQNPAGTVSVPRNAWSSKGFFVQAGNPA